MKFRVIDCYNQAYNLEEDIWEFKTEPTDYVIDITIENCSVDILDKLIKVGYLLETVTLDDIVFEWLECDLIDIRAKDTYEPIGRLEGF